MKALRFYDAKDVRIDEIPRPECGPDEVRIKVAYCGICGTDIHEYLAGPIFLPQKDEPNEFSGATLPQILGHELSGTLVEVGANVSKYKVGQRVVMNPHINDQQRGYDDCEFCRSGRHNICVRTTFYGVNGKGGGLADEIVVKPGNLVSLPDNIPLKVAALVEPLAVAAHMVRISGFRSGQDAVVLGAGPIGCSLTFLLKDSGAKRIIVSEVTSSRANQAKSCGADRVINPMEQDVLKAVREDMGTGADVTFDACGLQATLDTAIACTKSGGAIFNVAIHEKPVTVNMNQLLFFEKRLLCGNAYTGEDFERVIQLLSERAADVEGFITATVPLENAVEGAFLEIINNKSKHNKIMVKMSGDEV